MLGNSTQRCFVGSAELDKLGVPIGSWCIVQHNGFERVCSLWLRDDLQDGLIEVQDTVTMHSEAPRPHLSRKSNISIESIKPVPKPSTCPGIKVSVITDFKHLRNLQQVPREAVIRQLQHLLMGYAVTEGCMISIQSGSRFAGPKISHVIVEECISEKSTQTGMTGVAHQSKERDGFTLPSFEEASFKTTLPVGDSAVPYSPSLSDNLSKTSGTSVTNDEDRFSGAASLENQNKSPEMTLSSLTQDGSFSSEKPVSSQSEKEMDLPSSSSPLPSVGEDLQPGVSSEESSKLEVLLITEQTKITIKNISSTESIQHLYKRVDVRLGGLEEAASLLRKLIEYPAKYPESLGRTRSDAISWDSPKRTPRVWQDIPDAVCCFRMQG